MRAKSPKTVVTFTSMSDVMAMEASAPELGIPGRIIPVPSEVSAGCGMAWCADATHRDELVALLEHNDIAYEGIFTVNMY